MSGQQSPKRLSRGVIWQSSAAGLVVVGVPTVDRAYITPRFPNGISAADLTQASQDIQRETALFWFWGNLCPYAPRDAPYFTIGQSPLGSTAPLAPTPLAAFVVLSEEFGDSLQPPVRADLGDVLGDRWMWRPADPLTASVAQGLTNAELREALTAGLNRVAEAIERLAPPRAGMGHNGPPEDFPLTAEEREEAQQEIAATKAEVADLTKPLDRAKLEWLRKLAARLGAWGLLALGFATANASKGAIGELGKEMLKAAEAIDVSHTIHALIALFSG